MKINDKIEFVNHANINELKYDIFLKRMVLEQIDNYKNKIVLCSCIVIIVAMLVCLILPIFNISALIPSLISTVFFLIYIICILDIDSEVIGVGEKIMDIFLKFKNFPDTSREEIDDLKKVLELEETAILIEEYSENIDKMKIKITSSDSLCLKIKIVYIEPKTNNIKKIKYEHFFKKGEYEFIRGIKNLSIDIKELKLRLPEKYMSCL